MSSPSASVLGVGDPLLKIVCNLKDGFLKRGLKRLRLYHPPFPHFISVSEGDAETILARSMEYSELLTDVIIDGVWKRTAPGRLKELDKWIGAILQDPLPVPFRLLDVGGSDGSTTLDTIRYLEEHHGIIAVATILENQLRIHSYRRKYVRYYVAQNSKPILIQVGLLGVLFEENKAGEGVVFNPIVRRMREWLQARSVEKYFDVCDDIIFKNPIAKDNPNIGWLEDDLFRFNPSLVSKFEFVRCCNVLNLGYYRENEIYEAAINLVEYLRDDGFLLVGRTCDRATNCTHGASLWKKVGPSLQHIADLNGGSEIKEIFSDNLKTG